MIIFPHVSPKKSNRRESQQEQSPEIPCATLGADLGSQDSRAMAGHRLGEILTYFKMIFHTGFTYGLYMVLLWFDTGLLWFNMVLLWFDMSLLWFIYGLTMVYTWFILYGLCMVYVWICLNIFGYLWISGRGYFWRTPGSVRLSINEGTPNGWFLHVYTGKS